MISLQRLRSQATGDPCRLGLGLAVVLLFSPAQAIAQQDVDPSPRGTTGTFRFNRAALERSIDQALQVTTADPGADADAVADQAAPGAEYFDMLRARPTDMAGMFREVMVPRELGDRMLQMTYDRVGLTTLVVGVALAGMSAEGFDKDVNRAFGEGTTTFGGLSKRMETLGAATTAYPAAFGT